MATTPRKSGSVHLIADQIAPLSGPELRGYVEDRLGVSARQARASVSSWSVEGWMERDAEGRPAAIPNSVDNRCAIQVDRREESPARERRAGRTAGKSARLLDGRDDCR
jgi:hypothetical protein